MTEENISIFEEYLLKQSEKLKKKYEEHGHPESWWQNFMIAQELKSKLEDPCSRLLVATIESPTTEQVDQLFKSNPWAEVIVWPSGTFLFRPKQK